MRGVRNAATISTRGCQISPLIGVPRCTAHVAAMGCVKPYHRVSVNLSKFQVPQGCHTLLVGGHNGTPELAGVIGSRERSLPSDAGTADIEQLHRVSVKQKNNQRCQHLREDVVRGAGSSQCCYGIWRPMHPCLAWLSTNVSHKMCQLERGKRTGIRQMHPLVGTGNTRPVRWSQYMRPKFEQDEDPYQFVPWKLSTSWIEQSVHLAKHKRPHPSNTHSDDIHGLSEWSAYESRARPENNVHQGSSRKHIRRCKKNW